MDSPLALLVWASESPIACPCCAVVSRRQGSFETSGAGSGGGELCSQGCEGARKNQGGEPKGRKRNEAGHNITWARRTGGRAEGSRWKGLQDRGGRNPLGYTRWAGKPSQG